MLPDRDEAVVASLALHGFLTFSQVRRLHFAGLSVKPARRSLWRLERRGLAAAISAPHMGHRLAWCATGAGRRAAGLRGTTRQLRSVGGSKLAHTLATNEFCVALTEEASRRADRFSHLHWANEVAHRVPGGLFIADAVLTYERSDGSQAFRFLEMDLGTMPVATVQAKFLRYAILLRSGAWRRDYLAFPKLAVVLSGARRRERLQRLLVLATLTRNETPELEIQLAASDDIAREGPFAPVWHWPGEEGLRGFLR